jgi:hypothetical protein
MRNAALAMIAVPTIKKVAPLAMGLGLVLVLACSVLGEGVGVLVAAVAYVAVGAAWLSRRDRDEVAVPWGAVAAVAVAAGLVATIVHGNVRLDAFLPAWANASGGDRDGDDLARGGIGDGPDQVAGPDGDAGFDRSSFFCETDGQCLYDAFVESYGEPVKPTVDRTQWLRLQEEQIAEHRQQDLRNGREQPSRRSFSLRRERNKAEASPDAVLWVEADADQYPLRLPVLAFDHYEPGMGHWHEEADQAVISAMDNADADGYFHPVDQPVGGAWGRERDVTIRTGTYDANVLPLPGAMTRFRMGHVQRADLFASAAEPMLRVNRTSVPTGSVLDVTYRPAVRGRLATEPLADVAAGHVDHPVAARLAREWAGHLPRGWEQVDAVIDGLREHATLATNDVNTRHDREGERSAKPTSANVRDVRANDHVHACPVETFLHDTKEGDAHLFASSAVLMLRSLGYDARLAGGYYVAADTVDADSGQAVVTRQHAHVWPQVRLAIEAGYASSRDANQMGIARGGQWVDLEPTPGFAIADGAPTFSQQAATTWATFMNKLVAHWQALAFVGVVLTLLFVFRRFIIDLFDVALWRLRPTGDARSFVERTLALLDRRARRRGEPRPVHQSHSAWLGERHLSAVADWATFAPAGASPPMADVVTPLRDAVRGRRRS